MKKCPKCQTEYYDDTLEFCLEDGAKLAAVTGKYDEMPTFVSSPANAKTFEFKTSPLDKAPETNFRAPAAEDTKPAAKPLNHVIKTKSFEILEVVPVCLALAHNWWQWIYLDNQSYQSIGTFLISGYFLFWLALLIGGVVISFVALRFCDNKRFAYVSLVILAINLILYIVPKR